MLTYIGEKLNIKNNKDSFTPPSNIWEVGFFVLQYEHNSWSGKPFLAHICIFSYMGTDFNKWSSCSTHQEIYIPPWLNSRRLLSRVVHCFLSSESCWMKRKSWSFWTKFPLRYDEQIWDGSFPTVPVWQSLARSSQIAPRPPHSAHSIFCILASHPIMPVSAGKCAKQVKFRENFCDRDSQSFRGFLRLIQRITSIICELWVRRG